MPTGQWATATKWPEMSTPIYFSARLDLIGLERSEAALMAEKVVDKGIMNELEANQSRRQHTYGRRKANHRARGGLVPAYTDTSGKEVTGVRIGLGMK